MNEEPIFEFKCSICGEVHKGAPSVAFKTPDHYDRLSEQEKKSSGKISADFCEVADDRFVRVCLEVPILGFPETFLWGLWVSLSKKNYEEYGRKFKDEYNARYFGWVCNSLPGYPETVGLKTDVLVEGNKSRPLLSLHETDHPLFSEFKNGMSKKRAVEVYQAFKHKHIH
jgi:hypothetical protein